MVYNGYYKVMSNIPKMGHLPTPATQPTSKFFIVKVSVSYLIESERAEIETPNSTWKYPAW